MIGNEKTDVETVFGHLKTQLAFHRFHLRGKQGVKSDVGLVLMALNSRKSGKEIYGKKSVCNRKNECDFDNIYQSHTHFHFETGLLSHPFYLWNCREIHV
ncbi:hypothetical protein E1H99_07900 [Enterococcus hirae]|nr:hypothetical protein E1H99_07900 [Enterococcus hirae]